MPLDPDIAATLAALEALNAPPMSAGTPAQAREAFRFMTVEMRNPDHLVPVKETYDVMLPTPDGDLPARVYRPDHDRPVPTVLFVHGGGFVIGDIESHDNQARSICAGADAVVVSIDYRLAPEAPWPAAVQDAHAALRWIADHVDELGADPTRLAIAGDSAGGNIAAVAAQLARGDGLALAGQLLIYPTTDFDPEAAYPSRIDNASGYFLNVDDMEWFHHHYCGETTDFADPLLSPIRAADLSGLAPAVVATAEFDPLRDEGEAYAESLRAAGVEVDARRYDGMVHGFFDMGPFSRGARDATAEVISRFRSLLWR